MLRKVNPTAAKRIFCLLVMMLFLLPCFAQADVDLSSMSFEDLIALKEQINLAIWNCQEWKEVRVPAGTYLIGKDIPAGKWTIFSAPDNPNVAAKGIHVAISKKLKDNGASLDTSTASNHTSAAVGRDMESITWDLQEGYWLYINYGTAVFTPFTGYDFGFND